MEKRSAEVTTKAARGRSVARVSPVKSVSSGGSAIRQVKPAITQPMVAAAATPRIVTPVTTAAAALHRATGLERVELIREGVPASALDQIVRRMHISRERLYATLRLPRSTIDRKIKNNETLSAEHSERVIGLGRLIGQVEVMVAQSGSPAGFDADRWVGEWLERPLPALGGAAPGELMDTMEGQYLVSRLLAQSQSGAYA